MRGVFVDNSTDAVFSVHALLLLKQYLDAVATVVAYDIVHIVAVFIGVSVSLVSDVVMDIIVVVVVVSIIVVVVVVKSQRMSKNCLL